MKLQRLAPRLGSMDARRIKTLETTAGATPRIRGDTWIAIKRRVALRDNFTCAGCGIIRADNECDHVIPLSEGGSNGDANLQLLCSGPDGCHARKSKGEAKTRAGKD